MRTVTALEWPASSTTATPHLAGAVGHPLGAVERPAVDQPAQRAVAARGGERHGLARAQLDAGRRPADRRCAGCPRPRRRRPQGAHAQRQLAGRGDAHDVGRRRGLASCPRPGRRPNALNRMGSAAMPAELARPRRAVGMADPDHHRPVGAVARGPGIAEAGRRAGLVGDPPLAQRYRQGGEAFGQRRVGQHVADIPGRRRRRSGAPVRGRGRSRRTCGGAKLPPLARPA